jgi:hypothetical protein
VVATTWRLAGSMRARLWFSALTQNDPAPTATPPGAPPTGMAVGLLAGGSSWTASCGGSTPVDPSQPMTTALPPPAAMSLVQTVAVLPVTWRRARLTRTTSRM